MEKREGEPAGAGAEAGTPHPPAPPRPRPRPGRRRRSGGAGRGGEGGHRGGGQDRSIMVGRPCGRHGGAGGRAGGGVRGRRVRGVGAELCGARAGLQPLGAPSGRDRRSPSRQWPRVARGALCAAGPGLRGGSRRRPLAGGGPGGKARTRGDGSGPTRAGKPGCRVSVARQVRPPRAARPWGPRPRFEVLGNAAL